MEVKAVCNVVFADQRKIRSEIANGTMLISVALERWETIKEPAIQHYIISKIVTVLDDVQMALYKLGAESKQKVIFEDKGLVLCPGDMTDVDAIRYALDMLDSREAADKIFQELFDKGKLIKVTVNQAQEA